MSYHGSYRKEAIPFLKKALARTYRAGKFIGGRGPRRLFFKARQKKYYYRYTNFKPSSGRQTFHWFEGEEMIVRYRKLDNHGRSIGCHRYQGMALI